MYCYTFNEKFPATMVALMVLYYMFFHYSDNGAWMDKKLDGGSNGLLKGQKGETWEGGMRLVGHVYDHVCEAQCVRWTCCVLFYYASN